MNLEDTMAIWKFCQQHLIAKQLPIQEVFNQVLSPDKVNCQLKVSSLLKPTKLLSPLLSLSQDKINKLLSFIINHLKLTQTNTMESEICHKSQTEKESVTLSLSKDAAVALVQR